MGSIFGEGSFEMLIALIAFITSIASICITVVYNKKKTAPSAANSETATEK